MARVGYLLREAVWGERRLVGGVFRGLVLLSFLLAGRVLMGRRARPLPGANRRSIEPEIGEQVAILAGGAISQASESQGALETAKLIEKIPGTVLRWEIWLTTLYLGNFKIAMAGRGANSRRAHGRGWGTMNTGSAVQLLLPILGGAGRTERARVITAMSWHLACSGAETRIAKLLAWVAALRFAARHLVAPGPG